MNILKNKKGFTLIEMMAVIAIVAILVAITTPIVTDGKDKANAATNAANLRTVEGQISALRVTNPEAFVGEQQVVGEIIDRISQTVQAANNALRAVQNKKAEYEQDIVELEARKNDPNVGWFEKNVTIPGEIAIKQGLVSAAEKELPDLIAAVDDATHQADIIANRLKHSYYARDGKLDINGFIITAPTSKSLEVGGLELEEGVDMIVIISDTEIVASYSGLGRDCFAAVAQDGDEADISNYEHFFRDSDNDDICDLCLDPNRHSDDDKYIGDIDQEMQGGND